MEASQQGPWFSGMLHNVDQKTRFSFTRNALFNFKFWFKVYKKNKFVGLCFFSLSKFSNKVFENILEN